MRASLLVLVLLCLLPAVAVPSGDAALRRATTLTAPAPPARTRAVLATVLARKEFQEVQKNPFLATRPGWMEEMAKKWREFWKAIGEKWQRFWQPLRDFFKRTAPHWRPMPKWWESLGWHLRLLLWSLLAVMICVLLGRILFIYLRRRASAPAGDAPVRDPAARRRQEPLLWEQALEQAQALWARGETREALRVVLRACLLLLDARGVLRFDESRANGEVLRELRRQGRDDVRAALAPLVLSFDRGWYGMLDVSPDEFTRVLETSRALRLAVVKEP